MQYSPLFQRCFLLLLITVFMSAPVLANELSVRTGKHAQYSRLVFDWESRVGYTVSRNDKATLIITFGKAAQLNADAATSNPVANISAINVLQSNPLKISLSIPAQSRVRDLRAGNKVVVDVYHPPGGAQKQESLKVTQASAQPAEPAPTVPENTPAEPEPPAQDKLQSTQSEQTPPETKQIEMREEPTLITVSSTNNFGAAVFMFADRLWVVHDKTDILLKPQISGPRADEFTNMEELSSQKGKAFTFPSPTKSKPGTMLKGMGGGVLWRVSMGIGLQPENAIEPVRSGVARDDMRSGKLLWPLKGARNVLEFQDPLTDQKLFVVTVDDADQFIGFDRDFIDFKILHSPIGLAVQPKTDDIKVQIVRGGIEIRKSDGLTMVEQKLMTSMVEPKKEEDVKGLGPGRRIFDFRSWQLGGIENAHDNRLVILKSLKDQSGLAQSESLITLGKMYVANAMGSEALGILNFARLERPALRDNPEFSALYGVASALTYRYEDAYGYLSQKSLENFGEIEYWRALVFAEAGDWNQAVETLPQNLQILRDYPPILQNRIVPGLAEIVLRDGDLKRAKELLSIAKDNKKTMEEPQQAALMYLQGEAARQEGNIDLTKELWEELAAGPDDLYRAKAGLALARLKVNAGEITPKEAIDSLERLRYAWRGDELEMQINYWLGRTYYDGAEYFKGLTIMRDTVSFDPTTPLAKRVTAEMADLFTDIFLTEKLDNVSPLKAVGLYDEFKELLPLDARSQQIAERLAEHVAKADLLDRAADLLKFQLDHHLQGADVYRVAMRVAAWRLLDNEPDKAIEALNIAASKLEELPDEMKTPARYRNISLLRARALSRKGRPDQALALLNDLNATPDMNRLRADIAWTAGYWDDAAEALGDVILDQNISMTRPLDEQNTDLLLQRSIALNLSGDRIALANMRERYTDLMNQTAKAKVFEVITRPRQSGALADRETLLSVVSEVDLFKAFLDSYRETAAPVN